MQTFNDIVNEKFEVSEKYKSMNKSQLIESIGGKENYLRLKNTNAIENISDLRTFSQLINENRALSRTLMVEIAAGILSPIIANLERISPKLKITKGSIIWYCFTYGIAESLYELGSDILKEDKKLDFCRSFAKGMSKSVEYWATDKVMVKLLGVIGINVSVSSGFTRLPFHQIQKSLIESGWLFKILEPVVCGDEFFIYEGKKTSIWGMMMSVGESSFKRILKFF